MSKKKFNNSALNLQLQIVADINELLKTRGVNVSQLKVDLKVIKKKRKGFDKSEDIIIIEGDIHININSRINEKNNVYKVRDEDDEDDEVLDDDFNKP